MRGYLLRRAIICQATALSVSIWALMCLIVTAGSPLLLPSESSHNDTAPHRIMQSSSTDFLTLNSAVVLQSIEDHLFSTPVQRNVHKLFLSRVQYKGEEHTYPSLQYTFNGFWSSWKTNMKSKLLFAGDNIERNRTIEVYSDRGKRLPDQAIIISGFEYGLANMAGFLAQIMVDGIYADQCSKLTATSEANCESASEEERWAVPIKQWQTVQDYSFRDWNYKDKLVEYVNGGMNRLEYDPNSKFDHSFINSVSGVFTIGCHDVNSEGSRGSCPSSSSGVVKDISQRKTAFSKALSALRIPRLREFELVDATLDHLKGRKDGFVDNLMLYKRGEDFYPSQRYQFDDMVSAIEVFSRPPPNVTHPYTDKTSYFQSPDHLPFYIGDPYMRYGHKYGLGNIALFFANGLHLSIEKDDACDEPNEYEAYGKLPISNSCGQGGLSYQDMTCPDDSKNMACTVDEDMELTAVTFGRQIGSPPPLTCAPRSRIEFTGFWNFEIGREEKSEAYANENGRVDVSGCCWWGRGFLQSKGVCAFGRLNHYLGSKAKSVGIESLFPSVDFCRNPEAVCASQHNRKLTWMSGLFLWVDRVQPYNQGGFNFMEELRAFADSGFRDEEFILKTHNIVTMGCHDPPCPNSGCISSPTCMTSSEEDSGFMTKAYRTFTEVDLWSFPNSEGGSNMPSPSPSMCKIGCTNEPTNSPLDPTVTPSSSPFVDPTSTPTGAPTSLADQRRSYFVYVKTILENKREEIEKEIFSTPNTPVYTFDGFLKSLEDMFIQQPDGLAFYLGQDSHSNLGHGIASVAMFLAHASTRGLRLNECEEKVNGDFNDICPMTIAVMECPMLVESTTKRGILLNQSPCDVGRLNYIFGKRAHKDKRESARYNFDLCLRPQVICYESTVDSSGSIQDTSDIKYLLGMIEWVDRIQSYSWGHWNYIEKLKSFVDNGMNDFSFIDDFSTMVVKSSVDIDLRKSTFKELIHILFSELNPKPPSSTVGIQEITIPPYDFESPSFSPNFTPGDNTLDIGTQAPIENIVSPAPVVSPQSEPAQEFSEPEFSLPANTRVDLTNSSSTISMLAAMLCVALTAIQLL